MVNNKKLIDKYYNNYQNALQNQFLITLTQMMRKYLIPVNAFYKIKIINYYNIDNNYFFFYVKINSIVFNKNDKSFEQVVPIVFYDSQNQLSNIEKNNLDKIFQAILDKLFININSNRTPINGYIFISNLLPDNNIQNKLQKQLSKLIKEFINHMVLNSFLDNKELYNKIPKESRDTVYKLRLYNPKINVAEYPSNNQTIFQIDADLIDKQNVLMHKTINLSGKFLNYYNFNWYYNQYNIDLNPKQWQTQFENEIEKIIDTQHIYENKEIKLQLAKYNTLSQNYQFLLLKDNQQPNNILRLQKLLNIGFLQSIITNYKFDAKNNLIYLSLQPASDNQIYNLIFGENGIAVENNDFILYKNNDAMYTLEKAKQNLKDLMNLNVINKYYYKYDNNINFDKVLNNEINLLIDTYNKRLTLHSLQVREAMDRRVKEILKQNKKG